MATGDIFKWRITNDLSTIAKGGLVRHGLPTPSQCSYRDNTIRVAQSEGGTARHGYKNVEILWTKLSPNQAADLRDFVEASHAGNGLLYMTIKPLDGTGIAWMDVSGKPAISDIAPDAPIIGADGYIHSNIILNLGNVTVISTQPNFDL